MKPWQVMVEMLEAGEMPPKGKPQPTAEERRRLIAWVSAFLESEASLINKAGVRLDSFGDSRERLAEI